MKNIRIAVNARMLIKDRLDGTGYFAYQTLKRITLAHPEVEFIFLFDRKFSKEFIFSSNITPLIIPPPTRHPFLTYIWLEISLKLILNKIKPDLFLSPDGLLSLGAKCPQLAVIHDINFKHRPQDLLFWTAKFFNRYFPKFIAQANHIVTVSEFTKQDLIKEYRVEAKKIDVVYNGADENFKPLTDKQKEITKNKYTNGEDYFIFVGSISPRKNIPRLLAAFELFKKETNSKVKMIIVGALFWGKKEVDAALSKMNYTKDIIFTGRVPEAELTLLVGAAFCLTYVPYFEGFGIPLIEAMQANVPIISANVTSMPEIAGEAALYVDPLNIDDIKTAMAKITSDENFRNSLIDKGKIQSKKFSWEKSAENLWQNIEKVLSANTSF